MVIIQKCVYQRPQCHKIVCPKECTARRCPLEVVYHAQVCPRSGQAPQRVLIHDAAHQLHFAGRQAVLARESASAPWMEGMRDFHLVI